MLMELAAGGMDGRKFDSLPKSTELLPGGSVHGQAWKCFNFWAEKRSPWGWLVSVRRCQAGNYGDFPDNPTRNQLLLTGRDRGYCSTCVVSVEMRHICQNGKN